MKDPVVQVTIKVVAVRKNRPGYRDAERARAIVYEDVSPGMKLEVVNSLLALPDVVRVEAHTITEETWGDR